MSFSLRQSNRELPFRQIAFDVRQFTVRLVGAMYRTGDTDGVRRRIDEYGSPQIVLRADAHAGPQCGGSAAGAEPVTDAGQCIALLEREPEHTRRVAHGTAAAIGDLFADHRRMLASVALVHVLQHALAFAMGEVDIDVGRLTPIFAEKTLEEQVHADRIDGRDAEAVADGGIGGRTATLAENAFATRIAHDVPHDQEVAGHVEPADHAQFVRDLFFLLRRAGRAPALGGTGFHQLCQIVVFTDARWQRKLRQRWLELTDTELTPFRDQARGAQTGFVTEPALVMQRRGFQIPLAVGTESRAHCIQRAAVTQRRQRIVCGAALARCIVRVIRHHPRHTDASCDGNQLTHQRVFLGQPMIPDFDREGIVEQITQHTRHAIGFSDVAGRQRLRNCPTRTATQRVQAGAVLREQRK